MEIKDKEYTLEEVVELVNEQDGDFILNIKLEVDDGGSEGSNLDAGRNLEESLNEFEMSFTTPEIASFCTVIKSLQTTGHVEEALKTLENNIERGQAGVNKRKCIVLENKTMVYVLLIAFDLLIMILYCIIMKLLDMQIAF